MNNTQLLLEMQEKYLGKMAVYFGPAYRLAPIDTGDLLEVCEVKFSLSQWSVRLAAPRRPLWVPVDEVKLLEEF